MLIKKYFYNLVVEVSWGSVSIGRSVSVDWVSSLGIDWGGMNGLGDDWGGVNGVNSLHDWSCGWENLVRGLFREDL